jgi:acetaldehyde dehydrogenase/alcohol dehydrogenase
MGHNDISLILATGGPGMVKAAYSSGKPAIGVGAGNTPAVVDETADLKTAISSILMSKTFDNGMICASEQSVIAVETVYEAVKAEFKSRGAVILEAGEAKKLGEVLLKKGKLNADIVGQSAAKIAGLAGIKVAPNVKVLIGEASKIDASEPYAYEKLSPVLALYKAKDFEDAAVKAAALVEFGGIGQPRCSTPTPRTRTASTASARRSAPPACSSTCPARRAPSATSTTSSWSRPSRWAAARGAATPSAKT